LNESDILEQKLDDTSIISEDDEKGSEVSPKYDDFGNCLISSSSSCQSTDNRILWGRIIV
jgi:hypothetical protein